MVPKISVIVPVYKVEKYLKRCVDSILSQTFTDFELILVNDGSPDNCPSICDEYAKQDKRVCVIHQQNGGLSAARNAGIDWVFENSNSEWITFIDSDDWVHDRYLELLYYANMQNNTKISMCYLQMIYNDKFNEGSDFKTSIKTTEEAYVRNDMIEAYAQGRLYCKSLFENIRFPVRKLAEDIYTTHKIMFTQQRIAVLEPSLYYYFQANENSILSTFPYDNIDNFEAWVNQIEFYIEKKNDFMIKIAVRRYFMGIMDRLQRYKKDKYSSTNAKLLKRQANINIPKYEKYLDSQDPKDAWILLKVHPFRTKMRIYWRAVKQKLKIKKG